MAEWNSDTPWRQGQVLTGDAVKGLGIPGLESSSDLIVVVSHDCDISRVIEIEPNIECIYGSPIDRADGNFTYAKNPRKLHLPFSIAGREQMLEMNAPSKFAISKIALADFGPDRNVSIAWENLTILQRWLAARYRRAAFPDAFENRLTESGLKDKISKILSPLGQHIHAVFFDVDEGTEVIRVDPDDTYSLHINLLYDTGDDSQKAFTEASRACKEITEAFQNKLLIEGKWRYIELHECEATADRAMSYRNSVLLKKWSLDYVSIRDPWQPEPTE